MNSQIGSAFGVCLICLTLVAISLWTQPQAGGSDPPRQKLRRIIMADMFGRRWLAYQQGNSIHMIDVASINGFFVEPNRVTTFFAGRQLALDTTGKETVLADAARKYEAADPKPQLLDVIQEIFSEVR